MGKRLRKWYIGLRIQLRILRLHFVYIRKPEDAKTPEEMLEAIKKGSKLT